MAMSIEFCALPRTLRRDPRRAAPTRSRSASFCSQWRPALAIRSSMLPTPGRPLFRMAGTFAEAMRPHDVDAELALLLQDPWTAGGPGIDGFAIPFHLDVLGFFTTEVPAQPPAAAAWFAFGYGG